MAPVTKSMLEVMRPIHEKYMAEILQHDFYGRLLIVGNSGTGKSMLTRQLFSEAAQTQLISMYGTAAAPSAQGMGQETNSLGTKVIPLRLPIVDLSRFLEAEPDTSLDADPVGDLLSQWVQRKYGQDSVPYKLVLDVRGANLSVTARRSSLMSGGSTGDAPRPTLAGDSTAVPAGNPEGVMGLLLLLDGYDEAASLKMSILQYVKSLLMSEPGHLTLLSSRPGSIGAEECVELASLGFCSFAMCELEAADVANITRSTLTRLGDPQSLIQTILDDVAQPAYESLTKVPLVLTLLIHVIRRFAQQAQRNGETSTAASQGEIMRKTEIYQRAVRLILHQSDAAKFALREGRSDKAMVQRLEMLKTPRARVVFQTIAWYAHTRRARSFKWQDVSNVCTADKEMFSTVQDAFDQGRLPIFEKVEGCSSDESMVQFTHLSFQELMAGEYASAIVQYANASSSTDAYVSFFLSNTSHSLERERLSEQWWLQVWMHVCEMLQPTAFRDWLAVLAQDEQSKLRVGRRFTWMVVIPAGATLLAEVTSIDWDDHSCHQKFILRGCAQKAGVSKCSWITQEYYYGKPVREYVNGKLRQLPLDLTRVHWKHFGVCDIMRAAARGTDCDVVRTLVEFKVHTGTKDRQCMNVISTAWSSPPFVTLRCMVDELKLQGDDHALESEGTDNWGVCLCLRQAEGAFILHVTRAEIQLWKMPKCWLFEQVRDGTLPLGPDVDANFTEPSTKLSLLMVAAGFGQVEIVKRLLSRKASVNAQSLSGCTALTFAAECRGQGTADCLKLLIEAGADIHHIAGRADEHQWRIFHVIWIGGPSAAGQAVCRHGDEQKFDILLKAGYDVNFTNGTKPLMMEVLQSGNIPFVERMKDMLSWDPAKPLQTHITYKCGHRGAAWNYFLMSRLSAAKLILDWGMDIETDYDKHAGWIRYPFLEEVLNAFPLLGKDCPVLMTRLMQSGYDIYAPTGNVFFGAALPRAMYLSLKTVSSYMFVAFDFKFDPRRRLHWTLGNSFDLLKTLGQVGCTECWEDYQLVQAMKGDS